jgi:hypothetical protein
MIASSGARLAALLVALALVASPARADVNPTARATAEALFREGKRLMAAKRFDEACPKLEASYRIDPAEGALLNLGLCHEAQGKTATAWGELNDARAAARKSGHREREQLADKHIAALEPKLSRLTIVMPPIALSTPQAIDAQLDGVKLAQGAWDTPIPVDPGRHNVVVNAHETWQTTVEISDSDTRRVEIPARLFVAPLDAPTPKKSDESRGAWRKPAAFIAAGAGVVTLSLGVVFGVRALHLGSVSSEHCRGDVCDPTGLDAFHDARSSGAVADVMFPVALVAAGAATYFFLTAPSDARAPSPAVNARRLRPSLTVGSSRADIAIGGLF